MSFIVEFWSRIFSFLGNISLFALVRWKFPRVVNAKFVDGWVLGHLVLAFAALVFVAHFPAHWLALGFVFYGVLRVFEISIYQTNVLLFDEYRTVKSGTGGYVLAGYRRVVLLLLHNYFEVIVWLSSTYLFMEADFTRVWPGGSNTILGGLYSSFITMTTFGNFDLLPKTNRAALVLLFHSTVGLFMTLLSLARFISLLPVPRSDDATER